MPKPDWTQYATLTAYGTDGTPVATQEVLLDGGRCSAGSLNPNAPSADLPEAVDAARRTMLERAVFCRYQDLEDLADGSGPFFGGSAHGIADVMRELDMRVGVMRQLRTALLAAGSSELRGGETVHVFAASGGLVIVLDGDGQWIEAELNDTR